MFKYATLKNNIKTKDIIQVITPHFNGGIGQLEKLTEDCLTLVPIEDETFKEEYQSITHEVLLPLDDVKVIIKVNIKEIMKDD